MTAQLDFLGQQGLARLGVGPAFAREGGPALRSQFGRGYQRVIDLDHGRPQPFFLYASKKSKICSITTGCAQASVWAPPVTGSQIAFTPFALAWSTMALLASNTMTVS